MPSVVGFDCKAEKVFRWIVVFRRFKNMHNECYAFVVLAEDANVFTLLKAIRPIFVDPECGEFCTASLYAAGRFAKCYIVLHDRYKDDLSACLCPMEAPIELTGKASQWYGKF